MSSSGIGFGADNSAGTDRPVAVSRDEAKFKEIFGWNLEHDEPVCGMCEAASLARDLVMMDDHPPVAAMPIITDPTYFRDPFGETHDARDEGEE